MTRFPDWPERLARFLVERQATPFDPQKHNCGLFVCDAVLEMTGTDMGVEFREQGDLLSLAGEIEAIAERIASEFGLTEVHPKKAHRGDVVLIDMGDRKGLGIVGLNGTAVGAGDGLAQQPLSRCTRAWRIPY